jgi:L-histidine N-alpha-methyltransferase
MTSHFTLEDRLPAGHLMESLRSDVLHGLSTDPKALPPVWFYDAVGSELFERITELPEYYPTRAEHEILTLRAPEIAAAVRARTLVELGSGSSTKTRLLLDALREQGMLHGYVPVDVSESALRQAGTVLANAYPGVDVHALVADFHQHLGLSETEGPRLLAFLGGTIGNLLPHERALFLERVSSALEPGDALLLGTDLVKSPATLVAAYDDSAGVTAAFNKNLLSVLNQGLDADFDPGSFEHVAVWDPQQEWIEMRLRANRPLHVKIRELDLVVDFERGEELRTEISAKFREDRVRDELEQAGLSLAHWWTDSAGRYALSLAFPVGPQGSA